MSASWSGGIAARAAWVGGTAPRWPAAGWGHRQPVDLPEQRRETEHGQRHRHRDGKERQQAEPHAERPRSSATKPVATRATTIGAATCAAVDMEELATAPIIMGDSFGGAFAEVLIDRGFGASGVAIDPAAVRGVFRVPFPTLRSAWPVLKNPATWNKAMMLTPEQFHYAFANPMPAEKWRRAYEQYAIPCPGASVAPGWCTGESQSAHTFEGKFHSNSRAPLLIIGGKSDHIVPPSVTREPMSRYQGAP